MGWQQHFFQLLSITINQTDKFNIYCSQNEYIVCFGIMKWSAFLCSKLKACCLEFSLAIFLSILSSIPFHSMQCYSHHVFLAHDIPAADHDTAIMKNHCQTSETFLQANNRSLPYTWLYICYGSHSQSVDFTVCQSSYSHQYGGIFRF